MGRKGTPPDRERRIARLATEQGGVVGHDELRELGLEVEAIQSRLRSGRLVRVHRGVYGVGNAALTRRGRWIAALRALGPTAVLSHLSAAAVMDLAAERGRVHLSLPGRTGPARHRGLVVHRPRSLPADEIAVVDGLPVTTVARTLVDLAALLTEHQLERAIEQAEHLQLFDLAGLERTLDRSTGRRGVRHLRRAVAHWTVGAPTRSELETRFLALCRRARVPRPVVNSDRLGREVDFAWPDLRLIVEVDGYATHRSRRAFSRDRRRDREARQARWRIERFTWDDVALRPTTTVGEIATIVAAQRELVSTQEEVV